MGKKLKATVRELGPGHENCPECGNAYTPVKYYTGKLISVNSSRVNLSTNQVVRKYTSLGQHTGGICLRCARKQGLQRVPRMVLITVIGLLLAVPGVLMEINRIRDGGTSNGTILIALGGIMFLCGAIAALVYASSIEVRNATRNWASLYSLYIDRLRKDGNMWSGLEYLPPSAVRGK